MTPPLPGGDFRCPGFSPLPFFLTGANPLQLAAGPRLGEADHAVTPVGRPRRGGRERDNGARGRRLCAAPGAAAGEDPDARPPRRCSSSCSLPTPSAALPPSERRPGGSPGDRNTPRPARTDLSAGHEAGHQIAWQQRLLRLELVSQLVMIAAAAPLCGHTSLTCTNKPRLRTTAAVEKRKEKREKTSQMAP